MIWRERLAPVLAYACRGVHDPGGKTEAKSAFCSGSTRCLGSSELHADDRVCGLGLWWF
jgi:hypothetical protein